MSGTYEKISKNFVENKDKNWNEWLTFSKSFDKSGKQGLVGILKTENGDSCVFKISQYINFLINHESAIMKDLNSISTFCPHFCKHIGIITCEVDPKARKEGNPFVTESKHCIKKDVMICEYIKDSTKFYNFIRAEKDIDEKILYSTIKQVLLGIYIAQIKNKLTHYDLHSNNIMMKKCNKDLVFLYVLDNENQFVVPTWGYYPMIIDFGFSYSDALKDKPFWPSMGHTEIGFTSDRFDPIADPKLFLVTVSGEIKEKRATNKSKKLRRIVRNIFGTLDIDWNSGWDKEKGSISAADEVNEVIQKEIQESALFKDYFHYCIDIIQTLSTLPLKKKDCSKIRNNIKIFLNEWKKIEAQIISPFYNLYILKCIVNISRIIKPKYLKKETKDQAVAIFKDFLFLTIDSIADYCRPKDIHYEKMFCSLLLLADNIEGILYRKLEKISNKKNKQYSKLPLQSILQMYGAIDINLPSKYTYTKRTTVCVVDMQKEKSDLVKIPECYLEDINELTSIAQGTFIYDIIKENKLE